MWPHAVREADPTSGHVIDFAEARLTALRELSGEGGSAGPCGLEAMV